MLHNVGRCYSLNQYNTDKGCCSVLIDTGVASLYVAMTLHFDPYTEKFCHL